MNRRKTKPSRTPHGQRPSAGPGHINEREQLTPAQKRANALFWLIAVFGIGASLYFVSAIGHG
jgi:hypothetical protein